MGYIAKNATEESLKEIARQMRIENSFNILRELYAQGNITKEEYVTQLRKFYGWT